MISTSIRGAIVPGVAALALALSACGAGNEADDKPATGGSSESTAGGTTLSGTLNAGGASSQEKAQGAWVAAFQGANPDATINYQSIGSSGGREGFISGEFAFAGTDSAISKEESAAAAKTCGGDPIQVPGYVSPIAVAYNLPGVESLKLDAATLVKIFDGSIKKWNDAAIAALNKGVKLPDTAITPVHRSDGSGTQKNFQDYLAKAGGWAYEPEDEWPSDLGGEGGEGTSGVVAVIQGAKGAIGFIDNSAAEANSIPAVEVQVGENFVAPSPEAAAEVLSVSTPAGLSDSDLAVALARDTSAEGVYPIVLVSYLLACPTYSDAETAALTKGYLTYVLSQEGQAASAEAAGSAPLTGEIADKARALVDGIG